MRKLFGTDGIRGIAGEYPLDEGTTFAIGQALGHYLLRSHAGARVVIGQDTRQSSEWIANSLGRGLMSRGVAVESAGVITTPGVAFLARTRDFAAGVVVSASHNPWRDNGIKIFGHDGYKLPDEVELDIEREIFKHLEKTSAAEHVPPVRTLPGDPTLREAYLEWLVYSVTEDLSNINALVDCANGAATPIAHEVLRRCGLGATFIHDVPDGRNINADCGALHPEVVAAAVRDGNSESALKRYALGITFDGDADRALFCDDDGNVVNGDAILLLAARAMQQRGALVNDIVVATTMSNMGLEIALRRSGIQMLRAPVGDKYVLEEMKRSGAVLGGEQSGHIIFRDGEATTGDGLLTALRVMAKMVRSRQSLAEMVSDLKVFPQTIKNIRVREKKPFDQVPEIAESIREAEKELDGDGRIVVRYSGTEALARVMVEAESDEKMRRLTAIVADAIQRNLGH
ncbi:MAG TPA: phosphoglucosamine mutase [Terriglobales bacterium]|nr:phosphoglucosamine mutase [Terriglobales bacterium]